ncbi:MAG: hypothetical protein ACT4PT_01410 [Methanobacteriota archaeon]
MARLAWIALLIAPFAGCLGSEPEEGLQASTLPGASGLVAPTVLVRTGHVLVGVAHDIPAHLAETGGLLRPFVDTTFYVEIADVPTAFQVEAEWDTAFGMFQLMVVEPMDGDHPEVYEFELAGTGAPAYARESPVCIGVPPEELRPGRWAVMLHSGATVDAEITFTVTGVGGSVALVEEPVRLTAAEFLQAVQTREVKEPADCG